MVNSYTSSSEGRRLILLNDKIKNIVHGGNKNYDCNRKLQCVVHVFNSVLDTTTHYRYRS